MFIELRKSCRKYLPGVYKFYMLWKKKRRQQPLRLKQLKYVLKNIFKISTGDVVFVHTSLSYIIPVDFDPEDIVTMLKEIVGDTGTIAMPSFIDPMQKGYKDKVFDVKKTMGTSGLVNELFRMTPGTIRSAHPLRSIAAWGKHAHYLTCEHYKSTYSFDENSPFYKLVLLKAKIIGIGTDFKHFSFIHTIEDQNLDKYPPLYTELYTKKIILEDGTEVFSDYAHALDSLTKYNDFERIRPYFDKTKLYLHNLGKIPFFYADAEYTYYRGLELFEEGKTIYGDYIYKNPRNSSK